MLRAFVVFALALGSSALQAGGIHKCVTPTVTSYQSMPCADPRTEAPIAVPDAPAVRSGMRNPDEGTLVSSELGAETRLSDARASGFAARLPFGSVPLAVGMWDIEALNAPRWGRPDGVARTRDRLGWHEHWTYGDARGEVRQLEFLNGRLVAITPGSVRVAVIAHEPLN